MAPPRSSNYSACAPLWVISQENHSSEELLTVTLTLKGLPDLLAEDRASEQYTQESGDTNTVKTLLTAVVAATLAPFNHCTAYTATFDSEDSLIDTFAPADSFAISLNETRLEIIKRLLFYCKAVMRVEADGAVHFFVPTIDGTTWAATTAYNVNDYVQPVTPNNNFTYRCTTAGTTGGSEPTWPTVAGNTVADGTVVWTAVGFHYEYKVDVSGDHDLFAKAHRKRIVQPNYIEVSSSPDSDDAYTGFAEDTGSSDLTAMEKREHYYLRLASNAQATALAKAILQTYQLEGQKGSASVPINVGQEVYDYVKLTDSRQDDVRIGNVGYLQRIVKDGDWLMYIAFGDVRQGGFLGLFPEISSAGITPVEGGPIAPTLENLRQDLEGVVTYFGALVKQQGDLLRGINASLMALWAYVVGLRSTMVSSTQLQGVTDSLKVKLRLRIPVGVDNPAVSDTTYESYAGGIPAASTTSAYDVNWRAQTFKSPHSHIIKGVKLRLSRVGTPGTATVSIRAVDSSGKPTGSDLASATFNAATLTAVQYTGEWKDIPFASSVELDDNTEYAIVLRLSGGDATNRVDWLTTVGGDPYPRGKAWVSANSGVTWTGGDENYFQEYGQRAGYLWIEDATLHYGDQNGAERIISGVDTILSYADSVVLHEDKVVYN